MITGASRGLGAALAEELADVGVRLFLWGRDEGALMKVCDICLKKGADVSISAFDIADIPNTVLHLKEADKTAPLDDVYINAGLFDGARAPRALEELASEMAIVDVNMKAAIAVAHTAAACMRLRRRGHIVFISSLAGLFPLADAAGYSASKAGISAYASALREKMAGDGVAVSDVRPGHIMTEMTKGHTGVLPMLLSPPKAARLIVRSVARKKAVIAFPVPLSWLVSLSGLLPWRIRAFFGKTQRFHIE